VIGTDTPVPPNVVAGVQSLLAPGANSMLNNPETASTALHLPRSPRVRGSLLDERQPEARFTKATIPGPNLASAASVWYLADGSSAITDRETIDFYNPNSTPAFVLTTLVRGDGHHAYVVNDLPPYGRGTLDASDAAGLGDALGAIVRGTQPIYVERTLYHSSVEEEGTAAALLPGIRAPASHWYLPRLRLTRDEAEQVAVLNPGSAPAIVQIEATERHVLRPVLRLTIPALAVRALSLPGGASSAVVRVVSPATSGVVVEAHTTYGDGRGYMAQAGLTALSSYGYVLAPGAGDDRDYVMLVNPGKRGAHVTLTGFDAAGKRLGAIPLVVPAGQDVLTRLPASAAQRWQVVRFVSDQPVAANYAGFLAPGGERSLARSYAGSVSTAFTAPAFSHVFVEGDTRALLSAPRETLLLANPGNRAARVRIQLQATGGRHAERDLSLPPGAFERLPINSWAPPSQHSLVVLADQPILAARTIDFNEGNDRLLSYGIAGA
jgi:hypothetical protein